MKYKYIKILHEGEDYILVRYGKKELIGRRYTNEFEISGVAMMIIKTLLKKIEKMEKN